MRRFLTTALIILVLAVSAAGVAPAAHAASDAKEGDTCSNTNDCAPGLSCLPASNSLTGNTCQSGATTNIGTVDPAKKTPTPDETRTENASWSLNFVVSWIVKLFAWLVGVAALTLNYAMYYTVVGMGTYVSKLSAISLVWRILRDIGNILLIFGFLAIGISIIIDSEWYGGGRKLLPTLLIVAVFANFSLFAAEAMVDVGNLFATQIYKQISGGSLPELSGGAFGAATDVANERISTMILNKVGLQTIYGNGKVNTGIFEAGNSWLISFMSIILFVITAFVMFALAFILISRFIVLILLIMVSPVGVAGLAVPGLQGWAKKWWDTLFHQTITAPILLLMLYIALRVITDDAFLTGFGLSKDSDGWTGWVRAATGTNNLGGLAQVMLSFFVAMGLLLAVVYFAKTLSAAGAGWATKTAGKLTFGLTAAGMRASGGWASQRLSDSFTKGRFAKVGRVPILGRAVVGTLDRGAKASFDMRGTGALKNIPGSGIDAGAAQRGGFREWEKGKIKEREDYAKRLGKTSEEEKEQEMWETRARQQRKAHQEVLGRYDAEHRAERQPLESEVKAQRARVAELRAKADKSKADADKKELANAELTLSNQVKELDELRTKQQEVRRNLEDLQKETLANIEGKVRDIERAPQEGYAKGLNLYIDQSKRGFFRGAVNLLNPLRNTKAAENIRKEMNKSTADKNLDTLKKLLEDSAKSKTEGKKEESKPEAPKP